MRFMIGIFIVPKLLKIMNTHLPPARDAASMVHTSGFSLDEQLLEIYWAKKELDEFLPRIATYANPHEISNIALSQLAMIEKRVIWLLEAEAKGMLRDVNLK